VPYIPEVDREAFVLTQTTKDQATLYRRSSKPGDITRL
jgi:hypothetical protein